MALFGRNGDDEFASGGDVPAEITPHEFSQVAADPTPTLPTYVTPDFMEEAPRVLWNIIPLGVNTDGEEVNWNARINPNLIAVGPHGAGKATLVNIISSHCVSEAAGWIILAFDPADKLIHDEPHAAVTVLDTPELAHEAAIQLKEIIEERYSDMAEAGVKHFQHLTLPTVPVLVIASSDVFVNEDAALHVAELMRMGRAAGVFVAIFGESTTEIPADVMAQGSLKVAMAGATPESLEGLFDFVPNVDLLASLDEPISGRALIEQNSELTPVQLYANTAEEVTVTVVEETNGDSPEEVVVVVTEAPTFDEEFKVDPQLLENFQADVAALASLSGREDQEPSEEHVLFESLPESEYPVAPPRPDEDNGIVVLDNPAEITSEEVIAEPTYSTEYLDELDAPLPALDESFFVGDEAGNVILEHTTSEEVEVEEVDGETPLEVSDSGNESEADKPDDAEKTN